MTLLVGVDGGGTRLRVVVADEQGREIRRSETEEGTVVGADAASTVASRVTLAVRSALEAGGATLPARALWAGLAGAGREEGRRAVEEELRAAGLAERVVVGTDAEAAFHDAFGDDPGILLIAGTGSIAWARNEAGTVLRAGGWGARIGDEGSGYAVGISALRAVARAHDGRGAETGLTRSVPAALSLEAPEDLVGWSTGAAKSDVAGLVPVVAQAAASGDEVARAILREAADALASHVGALLERGGPWKEAPELVFWGGLLAEGGTLRRLARQQVERHRVRFSPRGVDPAMGAVGLALAGE